MAQIKISELNELETIQDNDLFVVVDESEGETRKAKSKNVRAKNKPLIAVTDEEPTEFNEDDEYYNTDTRLIYKAINSTTWSVEGKVPEEGIMYVVFPEKSTFAWDGSDLISVGGGSGSSDIIIIGDETEATEDTKLLVDTSGTTDTLKYKDNNSFTELQIKALDSLPVGSEIDFNGQVGDIPAGWEQVSDKSIMTLTVPDINPISLTEWNNYNITTGYTLANSVGTKLALNNGVKIGAGVSKVKVSAITKIYNNDNNNNTYQININKNGVAQQFTYDTIRAYDWLSEDLPMVLLDVQENDVITVGVTCSKTFSTARVFGGYLTVEEV